MEYAETQRKLWDFIGKEVRLTVLLRGDVVASFSAIISPPPDHAWLGDDWRPLSPLGDEAPPSRNHLVAMLVPDPFVGAAAMQNEMLRIAFKGGVELIVAPVREQRPPRNAS